MDDSFELFLGDGTLVTHIVDFEAGFGRDVVDVFELVEHVGEYVLDLLEFALSDDPFGPQIILEEHLFLGFGLFVLLILHHTEEVKELIKTNSTTTISIKRPHYLVQFILRHFDLHPVQILHKVFDADFLSVPVNQLQENGSHILAFFLLDYVEQFFKRVDGLSHRSRYLVVLVSERDLFQHRKRDRIDEDDATVHACRIHKENLLVALLQAEEPGLGVVIRLLIVK